MAGRENFDRLFGDFRRLNEQPSIDFIGNGSNNGLPGSFLPGASNSSFNPSSGFSFADSIRDTFKNISLPSFLGGPSNKNSSSRTGNSEGSITFDDVNGNGSGNSSGPGLLDGLKFLKDIFGLYQGSQTLGLKRKALDQSQQSLNEQLRTNKVNEGFINDRVASEKSRFNSDARIRNNFLSVSDPDAFAKDPANGGTRIKLLT